MNFSLLDTNIVSILFKLDHDARRVAAVAQSKSLGQGSARETDPDESTCQIWSDIMTESRFAGKPIATSDAWVAAAARQWDLPLVTTDYRDFEHLSGMKLVRVS